MRIRVWVCVLRVESSSLALRIYKDVSWVLCRRRDWHAMMYPYINCFKDLRLSIVYDLYDCIMVILKGNLELNVHSSARVSKSNTHAGGNNIRFCSYTQFICMPSYPVYVCHPGKYFSISFRFTFYYYCEKGNLYICIWWCMQSGSGSGMVC